MSENAKQGTVRKSALPQYLSVAPVKRMLKDCGIPRVSNELAVFIALELEKEVQKTGSQLSVFLNTVGVKTAQKQHLVAMQKFVATQMK